MNYEQIKADVQELKKFAKSIGWYGYCAIGSLLLTCCLSDHGIQSELVKGYLVSHDKYWALHIWNKIYIDDKTYQIDVVNNLVREMGVKVQYTLTLCDKWETLIDTKEEQDDFDQVTEFYKLYQEKGAEPAFAHFTKHRNNVDEMKIIFDRLSKLKTFSSIQKYRYILE